MNCPSQQTLTSLFVIPFFGIFVTYNDLLFGPNAGFQYYITFSTLILLLIVFGKAFYTKRTLSIKAIDVAWAAFLLYLTVNFGLNNSGFLFFKYQGLLVTAGLYVFFRTQSRQLIKQQNVIVPVLFSLVSLVLCGYALLQYFQVFPSRSGYFAFTSFFANPGPLAIFLSALSPYLIVPALDERNWSLPAVTARNIFLFISLLISVMIVYLSYSRTAWVALGVMAVICYFVFVYKKRLKILYIAGLATCFILVFALLYFIKPESAKGRILNYIVSYEIWKEFPYLGVGWNNFGQYYNQFQADYFQQYPASSFQQLADDIGVYYNEFIRMAMETGITGLLLFIGCLVLSLDYHRIKTSPAVVKSAWLSIIGILAAGLFSYPLSQTYVLVLFVFNLSILAGFDRRVVCEIKKINWIACIFIPFVLGHLYYEITVFRASLRWQEAFDTISRNEKQGLKKYKELYPTLKAYPPFLYNYGYELSMANRYDKSLEMLQKAEKNMYNLDLLLRKGYVHKQLNNFKKAEQNYLQARFLIPSRLVPRYLLMKLYDDWSKHEQAVQMAKEISNMEPKVSSDKALFIKNRAETYLNENT